jgi:hypothetical protein
VKLVREAERGVVHLIARCEDCTWGSDDRVAGRAAAGEHVKGTGHTVSLEVGTHSRLRPE